MSPYCNQMGRTEPSGGTQGATGMETAAPETDTPTPSPTPSVTPSPPPQQEDQGEAAAIEDGNQRLMAMNPPPMLQNGSPDWLPVDHNLPHLLKQVTGNADLVSVRDIKLRVISREMSLQRLALFVPNLRELNLDGSCLGSLRDLGCGMTSLQILRVSRCGLESLDGTYGLTSLRELHASNNMVNDVGPCSSLPHIRLIDLRKNWELMECVNYKRYDEDAVLRAISSLIVRVQRNSIEDTSFLEFLNICPHLEDLTLAESPAASKPGYRSTIRNLLPNLAILDGLPLTQEDEGEFEENLNDVSDNDDDEDGDDTHPNHDTMRKSSQRDVFQYRPETPQYPRRRGELGDGLQDVSQRPSINENIQENEVMLDDKAAVIAGPNMSNEADCSSSAYRADISQTFSNFHSTQSSSSDAVLVQNVQTPRKATFRRRPATSVDESDVSVGIPRSPLRTSTPRKPRPSSAIVMSDEGETTGASMGDPRCDSPSALTSGLVVYGNLTVALRSRRKRQDAWIEEEVSPAFKPNTVMHEMELKQADDEKQMEATADDGSGEGQELRGEEPTASEDSRDVLEESKKWREIYTAYRSDNRMRWEKEDEVGTAAASVIKEEKLTQDETKIKAEENMCARRKKIVDTATPCCPHLFTRQKPTCETSYDADTSSNLDLAPKNIKVNRKKRALTDSPKH